VGVRVTSKNTVGVGWRTWLGAMRNKTIPQQYAGRVAIINKIKKYRTRTRPSEIEDIKLPVLDDVTTNQMWHVP
jgi:hypothetical protein